MNLTRILKMISKFFSIYVIMTLIPSVAISYVLADDKVKTVENQYKNKAQWYANFHSMNIENFLGETVGRLEMLATSIKIQQYNLNDIEKILQETQEMDSRFSDFYFSNTKGDLLVSSNLLNTSLTNISDREYFQQAIGTRETTISDPHIDRVTGRYIITIATPVVDQGQTQGVLLASLRLDKIEEKITSLLEDEIIIVTDQKDLAIMKAGTITSEQYSINSSIDISEVPWTTTAIIIPEDEHIFQYAFILYISIIFTLTNIMFLLFKYLLLRRKVKTEKEQTEFQKLELIGNLAASTAHEIKNPLTGIKGLVKLLSEEYLDQKAHSYFNVIQSEIDRINSIVSELLVLGKPTAYTLNTYDVNEILAEIEPIILSETNYMNVQLSTSYSKDPLLVSCVKDHLKQVILNLTKNALQAMPNGGTINLSLEKQNHSCMIKVEDDGSGIPKELLSQAFNPFFTMKKDGSGLGLTVCKRIIHTYGGEISIESTLYVGTQVLIMLPLFLDSEDLSN